ncbi:MAG: hypothetical protein KJZ86_05925 [Caldilineaceae bacterium]|nr:hypothetical protein [Caldilineaceae bacterium]HRJ40332.1 hypothetical protein [Caldilineaceae bacterium]
MEIVCVSCSRGEDEVPLTEWRYQGDRFAVCPECLPMLIHHREQAMQRWHLNRQSGGDDDAPR